MGQENFSNYQNAPLGTVCADYDVSIYKKLTKFMHLKLTKYFYFYIYNPYHMPNTYTQIHIQFVFAVKFRKALIDPSWKDELHQYITGIIQNKLHKMLQINTMPDHLHMLIGFRPDDNISQLIQIVKSESSKWINDNHLTRQKFVWQDSFGAFSYSRSHVPDVIRYIQNQEQHHHKETFLEEYVHFLKAFEIEFDDRYIFKELAD